MTFATSSVLNALLLTGSVVGFVLLLLSPADYVLCWAFTLFSLTFPVLLVSLVGSARAPPWSCIAANAIPLPLACLIALSDLAAGFSWLYITLFLLVFSGIAYVKGWSKDDQSVTVFLSGFILAFMVMLVVTGSVSVWGF